MTNNMPDLLPCRTIWDFFTDHECERDEQVALIQQLAAFRMRRTLDLIDIPFRKKKNAKSTR